MKRNNMNRSKAIPILNQLIPALMSEADVPGLAIALIEAATVIWEHGFGVRDKETQAPIESDTIFGVASLSKPVFAYGVLQLCEKGVLELDTPLSQYYPIPYTEDGFNSSDPRLKLVTARQVLSHSAGFGNWRKDDIGRINFSPGEKFSYAGEGYLYLQRVIEYLTDIPLDEYMKQHALLPLGMQNSNYAWTKDFTHRTAEGYGKRHHVAADIRSAKPNAAYSLCSTVLDISTFIIDMMRSEESDAHHLSPRMLDEMISPQISVNQTLSWGIGWGIEKTAQGEYFWQWGDLGDYSGLALASRATHEGLVILTNSDEKSLRIFERIVQEIIPGDHPCFEYFVRKE